MVAWPAYSSEVGTYQAFMRQSRDPELRAEIQSIARGALRDTVLRGRMALPTAPNNALLRRAAAVFVTLVEHGQVRGCMGSLESVEENAAADIVRATVLAATQDYRYPPLRPSEVDSITPVVSIVGPRRRAHSLGELSPLRLGLYVERDGKASVLLPGEALSAARQLRDCKRKAGIASESEVVMYVFPTVVFDR